MEEDDFTNASNLLQDETSSSLAVEDLFSKWDSSYERASPMDRSIDTPKDSDSANKSQLLTGIIFMCIVALFQVVTSSISQSLLMSGSASDSGSSSTTSHSLNIIDLVFFRSFPTVML